jgi:RsiW-degrading membrane proteinase PrsW (M82 family)
MSGISFIIALLLAIAPALLLAWLIYRADHHEREARRPLFISLGLGAALPPLVFQVESQWLPLPPVLPSLGMLFLSVAVAALLEESLKTAALLVYPYRQSFFNEPMDGIVYAGMIGMGFALAENVWFAWHYGWTTILFRGLTAVPAHAIFAIVLGYYAGREKFATRHPSRFIATGWGWAVCLHALYNFLLLQSAYRWMLFLAAPLMGLSAWMCVDLIRRSEAESPFR